jgi:hypothetical protein
MLMLQTWLDYLLSTFNAPECYCGHSDAAILLMIAVLILVNT